MSRPVFSIDTSSPATRTTSFASSNAYSPTASTISDDTDLPFPEPLPRSDFLAPAFNPSNYLSTISQNRHQTLEDLRSELRTRSQALSQELLELVNAHYSDFLGLGTSLKGGEDRVQEVWGGLRSFVREVEGVRAEVAQREVEVRDLVGDRRSARSQIEKGRAMIQWEAGLSRMERSLLVEAGGVVSNEKTSTMEDEDSEEDVESDDEEEDIDDGDDVNNEISHDLLKLRRRVQEYQMQDYRAEKIGRDHPFVVAQQSRISKCRKMILLDLSNSLRQAGDDNAERLLIMSLYKDMDAFKEAITALKSLNSR